MPCIENMIILTQLISSIRQELLQIRVMRGWGKAYRQEEEEEAAGEDLCHPSAYNRRPSRARSPNYNIHLFREFKCPNNDSQGYQFHIVFVVKTVLTLFPVSFSGKLSYSFLL